MSGMTSTASPQQTPGLPENMDVIAFEGFEGINTQFRRLSTPPNQLWWCDGFMPFAKNRLRAMPSNAVTDIGFTAPAGTIIVSFKFFSLKSLTNNTGQQYVVIFTSDGAGTFLKNISGTWTTVLSLGAGTFTVNVITGSPYGTTLPGYNNPYAVQWGNQYLLIVAANGYFMFTGSTEGTGATPAVLYSGGATTSSVSPIVTIRAAGSGYNSATTTVTVAGGSGSGATFKAGFTGGQLTSIIVTNAGSGYTVTNGIGSVIGFTVTNTGGVGGAHTDSVATVTPVAGNTPTTAAVIWYDVTATGNVKNVRIVNSGEGYTSPPTLAFPDAGPAAAGTTTISTSPATLALYITDSSSPHPVGGAQATVALMPVGVAGSAIETYSTRAWVANGGKILFTAPGSPVDFGSTNGGGVITSTDSFLKNSYINLFQSNGFLYVTADSSTNYISGVTTSGTPVTTTFSNVNIDPQQGTTLRDSMQVFGHKIIYVAQDGIHAVNGGIVQKISSELDGFFDTYNGNTFDQFAPSSAQAHIYGQLCYMVLLPVPDPVTNVSSIKLVLWNGARWWTSPQSVNLIRLDTFEYNGDVTAYGSDGQKIYQLFDTTAPSTFTKKIMSRLFVNPSYLLTKRALRLLGLVYKDSATAPAITANIDNANPSASTSYALGALTDPQWLQSGQKFFTTNVEQTGYVLGLTISTTEANIDLQSFMLVDQQYTPQI